MAESNDGSEERADPSPRQAASPTVSSGRFVFSDGSSYEGEFERSESGAMIRSGRGKQLAGDGVVVAEGEWQDGVLHGTGVFRGQSGAVYEGEFVNGEFNGQGTYSWPDGAVYRGGWVANRMEGEGVYSDGRGTVHRGQFRGGMLVTADALVDVRE